MEKTFLEILREKLAAKKQLTQEAFATLRFNDRMDYFRSLKEDMVVNMREFSDALCALVSNPMFAGATEEEKNFLEYVVITYCKALYYKALQAYLKVSQSIAIADFFINEVMALEPAFREQLEVGDVRMETIRLAFTAVDVMAPEAKQEFAQLVQEMFPLLPKGKDGTPGFAGLIYSVANPPVAKVTSSVPSNAPHTLLADNGNGGVRVVARRTKTHDNNPHREGLPSEKFAPRSERIALAVGPAVASSEMPAVDGPVQRDTRPARPNPKVAPALSPLATQLAAKVDRSSLPPASSNGHSEVSLSAIISPELASAAVAQ